MLPERDRGSPQSRLPQ